MKTIYAVLHYKAVHILSTKQTFAFFGRIPHSVYSYLPQSQQHLLIDHPSPLKLKLRWRNVPT